MQMELYRMRKENGETQKDLANLLQVDESTYRKKENGQVDFKGSEMFIIADHYDKKINEIFLPNKYAKRKQNKELEV